MAELTCTNCDRTIETLPQHCGKDMIFNEAKNRYECYMGPECGYISLDEYVCDKCCNEE